MTLAVLAAVTVWMVLTLPAIFPIFDLECAERCPDVSDTDDVVLFDRCRLQPENRNLVFVKKPDFFAFGNRAHELNE